MRLPNSPPAPAAGRASLLARSSCGGLGRHSRLRGGRGIDVMFNGQPSRAKSTIIYFPTITNMVMRRDSINKESSMLADPLWLTALATLVASLASLVWAVRRKR